MFEEYLGGPEISTSFPMDGGYSDVGSSSVRRVVGQFQHVGQDAILQRVVNPRSLRRLAIGAQVTNLPHT
jgi:hypothetical protein